MTPWHSKLPRRVYSAPIWTIFIWMKREFNALSNETHIAYVLTIVKGYKRVMNSDLDNELAPFSACGRKMACR